MAEQAETKGKERAEQLIKGGKELFSRFASKIRGTFSRVREGANRAVFTAIGAPEAGLSKAREAAIAADDYLEEKATAGADAFKEVAGGVEELGNLANKEMRGVASGIASGVEGGLSDLVQKAGETFETVAGGVEEAGSLVNKELRGIGAGVASGVEQGITELVKAGTDAYEKKKLALLTELTRAGLDIEITAKEQEAALKAAIDSGIDLTTQKGKEFVKALALAKKDGLDLASTIGTDVLVGIGSVIEEGGKATAEWISETVTAAREAKDSVLKGIPEAARAIRDGVKRDLGNIFSRGRDTLRTFIGSTTRAAAQCDTSCNTARLLAEMAALKNQGIERDAQMAIMMKQIQEQNKLIALLAGLEKVPEPLSMDVDMSDLDEDEEVLS